MKPLPTWILLAGWGIGVANLASVRERPFWWDLLVLGSFLWFSYALAARWPTRPVYIGAIKINDSATARDWSSATDSVSRALRRLDGDT